MVLKPALAGVLASVLVSACGGRTFTVLDAPADGGPWTVIATERFATPSARFPGVAVGTCGAFGALLGGVGVLGMDARVRATFDLGGLPHRELRVRFGYVVIDSWDDETAFLDVDGVRVWGITCDKGQPTTCAQSVDECGLATYNDGLVPVDVVVPHQASSVALEIGASLDQTDEAWGISQLEVSVR